MTPMASKTEITMAYTEARLTGDDDRALSIARNNPACFEWCGEMPDGWDEGTDWSEADRLQLVAMGRIVWDDDAGYRPADAGGAA